MPYLSFQDIYQFSCGEFTAIGSTKVVDTFSLISRSVSKGSVFLTVSSVTTYSTDGTVNVNRYYLRPRSTKLKAK